jgi:hypothetical protein
MFSPKGEWRGFHSYEIVHQLGSEYCSNQHTFPIRFAFVAQRARRGGWGAAVQVEPGVKRWRGLRGWMNKICGIVQKETVPRRHGA